MYVVRGRGVRLYTRSATRGDDGAMEERDRVGERGGKRDRGWPGEDGKDMRELPVQLH